MTYFQFQNHKRNLSWRAGILFVFYKSFENSIQWVFIFTLPPTAPPKSTSLSPFPPNLVPFFFPPRSVCAAQIFLDMWNVVDFSAATFKKNWEIKESVSSPLQQIRGCKNNKGLVRHCCFPWVVWKFSVPPTLSSRTLCPVWQWLGE